MMICSNFPVF